MSDSFIKETFKVSELKPPLILAGEVNEEMAGEILKFLTYNSNFKELTIYLNTEGGKTDQAREIYAMIRAHGGVRIVAFGECSSAGTLILAAANERVCTRDCVFVVHYGEESADSDQAGRHNRKLFKWMKGVYRAHLTVGARTISNWFKADTYLDSARALKVGLVDEIIDWEFK